MQTAPLLNEQKWQKHGAMNKHGEQIRFILHEIQFKFFIHSFDGSKIGAQRAFQKLKFIWQRRPVGPRKHRDQPPERTKIIKDDSCNAETIDNGRFTQKPALWKLLSPNGRSW